MYRVNIIKQGITGAALRGGKKMPDECGETGYGSARVAVFWRKSGRSHATGNCVEVAGLEDGAVGVRDSKNPRGSVLRFTPEEWKKFLDGVSRGTSAPRD
jgi:hypothetical protein